MAASFNGSIAIIVLCYKISTILNKEMKNINLASLYSIMKSRISINVFRSHICTILEKEASYFNTVLFLLLLLVMMNRRVYLSIYLFLIIYLSLSIKNVIMKKKDSWEEDYPNTQFWKPPKKKSIQKLNFWKRILRIIWITPWLDLYIYINTTLKFVSEFFFL